MPHSRACASLTGRKNVLLTLNFAVGMTLSRRAGPSSLLDFLSTSRKISLPIKISCFSCGQHPSTLEEGDLPTAGRSQKHSWGEENSLLTPPGDRQRSFGIPRAWSNSFWSPWFSSSECETGKGIVVYWVQFPAFTHDTYWYSLYCYIYFVVFLLKIILQWIVESYSGVGLCVVSPLCLHGYKYGL